MTEARVTRSVQLQSDGLLDKAGRLLGTMMISYFRWESEMKAQHRMGFTVCTRCHSFVMRQTYQNFLLLSKSLAFRHPQLFTDTPSTSVDVAFV
jgi:hypothetical protein